MTWIMFSYFLKVDLLTAESITFLPLKTNIWGPMCQIVFKV